MSAGHPKVDMIMDKIRDNIKEDESYQNIINVIYKAIWALVLEVEDLQTKNLEHD